MKKKAKPKVQKYKLKTDVNISGPFPNPGLYTLLELAHVAERHGFDDHEFDAVSNLKVGEKFAVEDIVITRKR